MIHTSLPFFDRGRSMRLPVIVTATHFVSYFRQCRYNFRGQRLPLAVPYLSSLGYAASILAILGLLTATKSYFSCQMSTNNLYSSASRSSTLQYISRGRRVIPGLTSRRWRPRHVFHWSLSRLLECKDADINAKLFVPQEPREMYKILMKTRIL